MILYFMKKKALEHFKTNMDVLYTNYFSKETSDWMEGEYPDGVFEPFREIQDFELCPLNAGYSAGEIELENIKRVYMALRDISESQASDERLWAGLCNKNFYGYLRRRWKYDQTDIKNAKTDMTNIISRYYLTGQNRGYYFRNSISKCWWVGRLTYDASRKEDPFYYLDAIGSSDLNSKITEIFYNSTFTSNPTVLKGILEAMAWFYEKKIPLSDKEIIRPAMSYMNAVGGGIMIDAYGWEEIRDLLVEKMKELLSEKRSSSALLFDTDDEDEVVYEDSDADDAVSTMYAPGEHVEVETKNAGEVEEEQTGPQDDPDGKAAEEMDDLHIEAGKEDIAIDKGDTVKLQTTGGSGYSTRTIPEKPKMMLDRFLLGKRIGDEIFLSGKTYQVIDIQRKR